MAIRTVPVNVAQRDFDALLDEVAAGDGPVRIIGGRRAAVLVSEDEWLGLEETLFLLSIPGMGESIREGLKTPIEELTDTIDW
jgi:prevent-host-death family protein